MRIATETIVTDAWGRPCRRDAPEAGGGEFLTVGGVLLNALLLPHADDARASLDDKRLRHRLAVRIAAGGDVEIAAQEATRLQELVGRSPYRIDVIGEVCNQLDGR